MEKRRVLYHYPYLNFDTGSPKAMAHFIESLDKEMFEPVYCAPGEGPLVQALSRRGVEIVWGKAGRLDFHHPFKSLGAILRTAAQLRRWQIDLLHANGFFWNDEIVLAAWMTGIPVILHVHNPIDVAYQNLVRFAARKILFCSRYEMDNCGHIERIAWKSEVLYNAIDIGQLERAQSIREELGVRETDVVIGTVAQIVQRKGIDILMDTARVLLRERTDLVFLIAGPTGEKEEEFGRRMAALAEEPCLCGRVRFLGSRNDIPNFVASLDLFVLPSRAEPLGIVVLEAMGVGCPVIASKVGGIPEIISSPELGTLVEPVTADAFADAIREVLSRPDRGKTMGRKARENLAGRFDLSSRGERLKDLYCAVLGSASNIHQ